jgi:hypothetical protein
MAGVLQKYQALQTEFDELNHMLTHQPPSAWAKREKKYHDDKKAWDLEAAELRGKTKRLQDEVQTLKDNNRAVVLQEQVMVSPLPFSLAYSAKIAAGPGASETVLNDFRLQSISHMDA